MDEFDDLIDDPTEEQEDELDEVLEDIDDIAGSGVENTTKITLPIMTIYEKSKVISNRVSQLDQNYKSTMEKEIKELGLTKSYDIAMLEFSNGKLPPYEVKRQFPNNTYELWRHEDFEIFP